MASPELDNKTYTRDEMLGILKEKLSRLEMQHVMIVDWYYGLNKKSKDNLTAEEADILRQRLSRILAAINGLRNEIAALAAT